MVAQEIDLNAGLYTASEAAMYGRVRTTMVNRWLFGTRQTEPVFEGTYRDSGQKLVTFLDFVQMLAIRAIRIQRNIPLQKIRTALQRASETYQIDHPFAREHRTFFLDGEIYIQLPGEADLMQLTGRYADHRRMKKIVEPHLEDLTFEHGVAAAYRACRDGDLEIVMNPFRRLGEPVVQSCGYTAQTLWEACQTEGGIEPAARAYGVTPEEVRLAYNYYDSLQVADAV